MPDDEKKRQRERRRLAREKSKPKRNAKRKLRKNLPVVVEQVPVAAEQLPDGMTFEDFRSLGQSEVIRRVDHVREHLVVVEYHQQTLASKDGDHIVQALAPPQVTEGGHFGPGLHAHVAVAKCLDSLPLHRIEKMMERLGALSLAQLCVPSFIEPRSCFLPFISVCFTPCARLLTYMRTKRRCACKPRANASKAGFGLCSANAPLLIPSTNLEAKVSQRNPWVEPWVRSLLMGIQDTTWLTPARADTAPGRYEVDVGAGTVLDTATGRTWQRGDSGDALTWDKAAAYCAAMQLAGIGWRLPTIGELESIVDFTRTSAPTIDITAFSDTQGANYWSSTPYVLATNGRAWSVFFGNGLSFHYDYQAGNAFRVRCVR